MMKKLFFFAAAVMMLAAACQKQELDPLADGDTKVTFTVSAGDVATRAIADGKNIDVLYWEIYGDLAGAALGEGVVRDSDGDKTFTVELSLVADQTYNIIFWAQVDGQNHYVVDDLRNVGIKTYDDEMANDESRAAFFAVHPFTTENGHAVKETVYLYRPFSQLNLGATTLETSLNLVNSGNISVTSTEVLVTNIATSFNTLTGEGEGVQAVKFQHAATPVDHTQKLLEVNEQFYHWLGMNYLIVNGNADNVTVDIAVKTNMGDVNHTVSNVPVKENHRTNILGNLLTTGAVFTVVVDDRFVDPVTGEINPDITMIDVLEKVLEEGGEMTLIDDLVLTDGTSLVVPEGKVVDINLNGYSIINSVKGAAAIINNGTLTLSDGAVLNGNVEAQLSAAIVNTGKLVLDNVDTGASGNGETAAGNRGAAIQNKGGDVVVNGGTHGTIHRGNKWDGYAYVFINNAGTMTINDAVVEGYPNGIFYATKGSIAVNGGSYKILPGANTWYVAYAEDGSVIYLNSGTYQWNSIFGTAATYGNVVVSEDCVTNWTAATTPVIDTQAEFEAALAQGGTILLAPLAQTRSAGAYVWKSATDGAVIKAFEIVATDEGVVIDMDSQSNEYLTSNIDVAFNGVELKFNNVIYAGFWHGSKMTFTNCTISGQPFLNAVATFTGCTFNQPDNAYCMWTWGATELNLSNCTFNTNGKAVLVYASGASEIAVNVDNCNFYADQDRGKGAIEIHTELGLKGVLKVNNSTAEGFGKGLFYEVNNNSGVPTNNFTKIVDGQLNVVVDNEADFKELVEAAGDAGAGNTTISITKDLDLSTVAWSPISVDGYHGADVVTVEGNGATITGLTGALFAGGFAGGSGIVIKDLTIADATIIADNTQGYGAFVNCADSMDEITLVNCHLVNSTIITPDDGNAESRIGGLVGWTAGYNNVNDGPVDSYITIEDCSVTGCTIKGFGSIGGICGHAGANAATFTTIKDCTVTGNTFISTDDGGWRVGVVVGTANNGQCVISNITENGNVLEQTGKTAPEGVKRNYYGRFVPAGTGTLTIDGVSIAQ